VTPTKVGPSDVWEAVAAGEDTATKVAAKLSITRGYASTYLRIMAEVGLLHAEPTTRRHASGNRASREVVYSVDREAALRMGW